MAMAPQLVRQSFAQVQIAHDLSGRQHGHDEVRIGQSVETIGNAAAMLAGHLHGALAHTVVHGERVVCACDAARHGSSHRTHADEGDVHRLLSG